MYVEQGGHGRDQYHDPFDYMDRYAMGGALPANWKDPREWTTRDYDRLGEIMAEYSNRQRGRQMCGSWGGGSPFSGNSPFSMMGDDFGGSGSGGGGSGRGSRRHRGPSWSDFETLRENMQDTYRRMADTYKKKLEERDTWYMGSEADLRKERFENRMCEILQSGMAKRMGVMNQMGGAGMNPMAGMGMNAMGGGGGGLNPMGGGNMNLMGGVGMNPMGGGAMMNAMGGMPQMGGAMGGGAMPGAMGGLGINPGALAAMMGGGMPSAMGGGMPGMDAFGGGEDLMSGANPFGMGQGIGGGRMPRRNNTFRGGRAGRGGFGGGGAGWDGEEDWGGGMGHGRRQGFGRGGGGRGFGMDGDDDGEYVLPNPFRAVKLC